MKNDDSLPEKVTSGGIHAQKSVERKCNEVIDLCDSDSSDDHSESRNRSEVYASHNLQKNTHQDSERRLHEEDEYEKDGEEEDEEYEDEVDEYEADSFLVDIPENHDGDFDIENDASEESNSGAESSADNNCDIDDMSSIDPERILPSSSGLSGERRSSRLTGLSSRQYRDDDGSLEEMEDDESHNTNAFGDENGSDATSINTETYSSDEDNKYIIANNRASTARAAAEVIRGTNVETRAIRDSGDGGNNSRGDERGMLRESLDG